MTTDEFQDDWDAEESPRHQRILDAMKERSADVVGQAKGAANTAASAARGAASTAADKARSASGSAGGAGKGAAGSAGNALSGMRDRFKAAGGEAKKAASEAEDQLWADFMRRTGRDRQDDT